MSSSIFLSYAHADRVRAEQLILCLRNAGYSVWSDHAIRTGNQFDQDIEAAISAAKVVVVLWSERSVASDWVRAEAAWALEDEKLLPVRLDGVRPPLRFIQLQTVNLATWRGNDDSPELSKLLAELSERLGPGDLDSANPNSAVPAAEATKSAGSHSRRRLVLIALCIVGVAATGAFALLRPGQQIRSLSDTSSAQEESAASKGNIAEPPASKEAAAEVDASRANSSLQGGVVQPKKEPGQEASALRADAPPASPPRPSVAELIGEPILFEKGKVGLSPASRLAIEQKIALLKENPGTAVTIEGHSFDDEGPRETVQTLAELRAMGVRRALVGGGIDEGRLGITSRVDAPAANPSPGGGQEPRVVLRKR